MGLHGCFQGTGRPPGGCPGKLPRRQGRALSLKARRPGRRPAPGEATCRLGDDLRPSRQPQEESVRRPKLQRLRKPLGSHLGSSL